MDKTLDVLRYFKAKDVLLSLDTAGLSIKASGNIENLTEADKATIKERKQDLIALLREARQGESNSIKPAPIQDSYSLSSGQKRLWILGQFEESNVVYNIPLTCLFEGVLNKPLLDAAFKSLITRHEILRTVFRQDEEGTIKQYILPALSFTIDYTDIRDAVAKEAIVAEKIRAAVHHSFDLEAGPLLRAELCQMSDQSWVFIYVMHHIVSDGWSIDVFIRELMQLYTAFCNGGADPLPPLSIQYKDYAHWQQQQLESGTLRQHEEYWQRQLGGTLPVIDNLGDKVRVKEKRYKGSSVHRQLDTSLTTLIRSFSREQECTLFMTLLATVKALLYRYTGKNELIIGSPVAGREYPELQGQIGFYVNNLALRTQVQADTDFISLLDQVKRVTLDAYEHQAYPYEELLDVLRPADNSFFDVVMLLQHAGASVDISAGQLKISPYKAEGSQLSKFDMTFAFTDREDELQLTIEYNTDCFSEGFVSQLARHLENLLRAVMAAPLEPVLQIPILSVADTHQLLHDFNDTFYAYTSQPDIVSVFEAQVQQTPHHVALVYEGKEYSYHSLNEQANRFAHYLRDRYDLQGEDIVAIRLDRSEWLIISILAVLKAGGTYLPIDTQFPPERVEYILDDSKAKLLINSPEIEEYESLGVQYPEYNPAVPVLPRQSAYVMYTSGTSGRPKGVIIEHIGVVRLVKPASYATFDTGTVILSTASISFDATTIEYWGALLNGGRLIFYSNDTLLDTHLLAETIRVHHVNTMWFTAGWLHQLIDEHIEVFNGLTMVLAGGDKLSLTHINLLLRTYPSLEIVNGYGPTENSSISLTCSLSEAQDIVPVGKPIYNSTAYILNEQLQLCPIGVIGEICVGGDGLARGYLNNPELTAQKFVTHPFKGGAYIYKTGDLGRWLPDGNIEFMGRKDDQVKIRGYRVEPREIEAVIEEHEEVDAAVVLAKVSPLTGEKVLVAYFTAGSALHIPDVQAYLRERLPVYMLPEYYLQLDTFPLGTSGKVDRHRLPDPQGEAINTGAPYEAPVSETAKQLALIWQSILGRAPIGLKDNFFDLGGHSLKATRLLSFIYKSFEVKLPLKSLFAYPVLEDQVRLIEQQVKISYTTIAPVPDQAYYPLSSAQKRIFFLQEFAPESTSYNMPMVHYLGRNIDRDRINSALLQLISRHESLRTSFVKVDSVVMQQIAEQVVFELEEYSCTRHEVEDYLYSFVRPFDPGKAPLLRAALVDVKDVGYYWIVDIHHIISDGTSMQVLTEDFLRLYQGQVLPALKLQYRDFSTWQNGMRESGEMELQKEYWLSQFSRPVTRLDFPADRLRPSAFSFEGASHAFKLDEVQTARLQDFCRKQNGTLQMVLLSVLNTVLYKYTGQDDIIIGCGIAGRRHPDLERIVGMFVNTLAIRNYPEGEKSFEQFYTEVANSCLSAYENQDLQFEDLVDMLKLERDASSNPVFTVALVVQNFVRSNIDSSVLLTDTISGDELVSAWKGTLTSKYDMSWFVTELDDHIAVNLEYYAAIYNADTIERLARHFRYVLDVVLDNPDILLSAINILMEEDAQLLMHQYLSGPALKPLSAGNFHELFAHNTSGDIAIVDNGQSFTYSELTRQSDQLARFLTDEVGLRKEAMVGVLQSKSKDLIVAILGISKAGGVYVPLDSNYPEERLLYMLEDARISVLLTEGKLIEQANRLQWRSKEIRHLICIDTTDIYAERGALRNDLMRKDLWDHVGDTAADAISGGGWMSSYTGEYLSEEEMKEYSENAYLKLKGHLHPHTRVLEIGCSSGLTMFQIAPHVGSYHGTDLSSVILSNTEKVIREKGYEHISLSCLPAHEIDQLDDTGFDLVIINSVIQSFDGHNYLRDVLTKVIAKVKDKGMIFVGDIMDEERRDQLLQSLLEFQQMHAEEGYRTKTDLSAELFVSKAFLEDLLLDDMGIAAVDCSEKIYTIPNELTEFRFDAILHIDKQAVPGERLRHKYQYDLTDIHACLPELPLNVPVSNEQIAYVIYTSGSTGKPKGVMVSHGNIVSFFAKCISQFGINSGIRMPVLASHAFDISLFELFFPLLSGGTTVIPGNEQLKDISLLAEQLKAVTAFHAVPALMTQVIGLIRENDTARDYLNLTDLYTGGDAVPTSLLKELREVLPWARIHTFYGPTESTVFVTAKVYPTDTALVFKGSNLGKPNAGVTIYVMDEHKQLLPVGLTGEICVGGPVVSKGYLNKPALTAEKFVPDPLREGELLYRTGDLGRWMADGSIEFLGRRDSQVKIRGFRIELGEIETIIGQYPAVDTAVVVARPNRQGENELAAYIVCKGDETITTADIRSYLGRVLPDYMVPVHFVQLAKMPLTLNGKIDRKQLLEITGDELDTGTSYLAPRNETEEKLAQIWQELLGKDRVGVKDNFFELGGHSLKATRLTSQIHKTFDVKIELKDLFLQPVLEAQATLVQQAGNNTFIAIPVAPVQKDYPLSSAQRRLWIVSQFREANVAYNMSGIYRFEKGLNLPAFQSAFKALLERHESLRTIFKENSAGEVRQSFLGIETAGLAITLEDVTEDALPVLIQATCSLPFDLAEGPLLRARLYRIAEDKYVFLYVMHHIISDGWSLGILVEELLLFYNACLEGKAVPLPGLSLQYKDYATWEHQELHGKAFAAHRNYWLRQFETVPDVLALPGDFKRPALKTYNGNVVRTTLKAPLVKGLRTLADEQGSTLFMGLLATLNVLLYRYTHQEDIVIGTPVAGRQHADLEDQIGCYVNTLALRTAFKGSESFRDLLSHVKQVTMDAYDHQLFPFDELITLLDLHQDMSHSVLFDVMIVLQNNEDRYTEGAIDIGELKVNDYDGSAIWSCHFDLIFDFVELGDEIGVRIKYNTDIYAHASIARLADHLEQLLETIIIAPSTPLGALDYLGEGEKVKLLRDFNNTAFSYGEDACIVSLFSIQAASTPDKTALVFEGKRITYAELERKTNQLAHYLRTEYKVEREELIGVLLDRSELLIIAILGILKAGCAYVPVDTSFPEGRKQFIFSDTGIKVLLTQTDYVFDISYFEGAVFAMDVQCDSLTTPDTALEQPVMGDQLAYVMYTSGSTGNPKGVLVCHRSIVRLVITPNYVTLNGEEVLLSTGAVSFDATTFEYWGMLLNGGCLVLSSRETLLDAGQLSAVIRREQVSMMWLTAGWLHQLIDHHIGVFAGLKTILAGGDKLSSVHLRILKEHYPSLRIINGYGPTENTTFSLAYEIEEVYDDIPIGKPINNTTAYILNEQQGLQPVGVVGEICVGGSGLARGYLNNDALTAEKFIPHPFEEGERLYRTGDLGKWLPDGNIVFAGRKDNQVKIRGNRVEPGEVEVVLQKHPAVTAAVVTVYTNASGEKELVAYVVGEGPVDVAGLNAHLGETLPVYMLPTHYVQMASFPLNTNGKVDRKQLPSPEGAGIVTGVEYIAPRNEIETQLVEIWKEILGKESIGVKDDFFDLGGHSLKATRLASLIHRAFNVRLEFKELFNNMVLEDQAGLIAQARKTTYVTIPQVPVQASYELSSAQKRLWILSQLEDHSIAYNIPGVYVLEGELSVSSLEAAFGALLDRHEILRTSFVEETEGVVKQVIQPAIGSNYKIPYTDLRDTSDVDAVLKLQLENAAMKPFDLRTDKLLRVHLYRLSEDKWVLGYVMHHIISDGWSMGILINELLQYYNGYQTGTTVALRPLRIQYKDYAGWQQEQLSGEQLDAHRNYWLQQMEGPLPVLDLPGDHVRPAIKTSNGHLLEAQLDEALINQLRDLCQEQGATLFMGLLAVVNTLLYRYTSQEDLIIGTPVAGREHADLEDQIGFYVNTLALRTQLTGGMSYKELLHVVKQVSLDAYAHQIYPFDELVEQLDLPRDMSRSALFDVMIVLQNNAINERQGNNPDGLKVSNYPGLEMQVSKYDLIFHFVETGGGVLGIEYNTDIFESSTIHRFIDHLKRLMAAICENPDAALYSLDMLNSAEKQVLLSSEEIDYPRDKTIIALFEEQVSRTPDNIALVFEGQTMSYRELNTAANRIGAYLRDKYAIRADDLIAVQLGRSPEMIIALLAVLKSGGAYVPIDPAYPAERITYMQTDSNALLVIDAAMFTELSEASAEYDGENPVPASKPDDLIYVIYTSGTTGRPKGSLITHRNVVRLFKTDQPLFDFSDQDVWTLFHSYCFDFSVWEMYGALLYGGKLVILSEHTVKDVPQLLSVLAQEGVTILNQTPGSFYQLIHAGLSAHQLRYVIFGGEALSPSRLLEWHLRNAEVKLINMYGITETTVHVTYKLLAREDMEKGLSNIGKPIPTLSAYVLDSYGQLVAAGIAGELYVGGAGVGRGYLNREELTNERFITGDVVPGQRLYRTGDRARLLANGELEYFGRLDAQVKIRGHRVELGEVTHVLNNHPEISSAVATVRADANGEQEIIGYITGARSFTTQELRSYMQDHLPAYMCPAYFVQLESIPLTPNGKTDYKRLPDVGSGHMESGRDYVAPRNVLEEQLVKIWTSLLGKELIGVKDDFFESGGNSLKATRLSSHIYKELGVKVSIKELFIHSVLEEQAVLIGEGLKEVFTQIPVAPVQSGYPLSSSQRRLWILSQFEGGNTAYNMPAVYVFEGALDRTALENAFDVLIARHEILRTVFKGDVSGNIQQLVRRPEDAAFYIAYQDLRNEDDQHKVLAGAIHKTAVADFDLAEGPLLRAGLYQLADDKWIFVYVMHHIISDGWSMNLLIRELLQIYQQSEGTLTPLRIQYKDYAVWQQEQLNGTALQEYKQYWTERFSGTLPVLELPCDYARPVVKTYNGAAVRTYLNSKITEAIKSLNRETNSTLFMGLLAAVNALLYTYTRQEDIIIGTPVAGRQHMDLENQVGCYLNMLPLRVQFAGNDSYRELLENTRQVTMDAYEHQAYPFDALVDALKLQRDMSHSALFDVMVTLQNAEFDQQERYLQLGDLKAYAYEDESVLLSKYDLSFDFVETDGGIAASIIYNSDLYSEATMKQLSAHLEQLLEVMTIHADIPVNELDFLNREEKDRLLLSFNDTTADYPETNTLISLFEAQVDKRPDAVALIFEGKAYSYNELNERANQLGAYLRTQYAIQPDDLVAIQLPRTEWMIISILGVLKAGGAYVPIDPEYPQDRINYILHDAGCKVCIDLQELEKFSVVREGYVKQNLDQVNTPKHLAYVIYTSGSTGRPKGCMLEHQGVVNRIAWMWQHYGYNTSDVILQKTTFTFDVSVWEIFMPLCFGAKMVLCHKDDIAVPQRIVSLIQQHGVTCLHFVPGMLAAFLSVLSVEEHLWAGLQGLNKVITSGEALPPEIVKRWYNKTEIPLHNLYGPTEASVDVTYYAVKKEDMLVPIGRPIWNTRIYILSENNQLLPPGVAGEICIGGIGVSRGYLNQPALTAEKFITDPFLEGQRIYKTGDLGKWLQDGNILYIGRIDGQVKIRGYRIETGEIEKLLQDHPDIDNAAVIARTGADGDKELVAYITARLSLNISLIRTYLGQLLPAYMIPAHYVQLDALPLSSNGKIDRKQLPDPQGLGVSTGVEYVAPGNKLEEEMAAIWEDVLGRNPIGIKDNFFALGGHSIKILQLIGRINQAFGVKINIQHIFIEPTIESTCEYIAFLRNQQEKQQLKDKLTGIEI